MATRLYVQSTTPALTPNRNAQWEEPTTGPTPLFRELAAAGNAQAYPFVAHSQAETGSSATNARDCHLLTLVSPPLAGPGTIPSGLFKAVFRAWESAAAANIMNQCVVYVIDSTGALRGSWYAGHSTTAVANEFPGNTSSSAAVRQFPTAGISLGSFAYQDGDRIVIEIGYRACNASTTNYTAGVHVGYDPGVADHTAGNTTVTTQLNPFVEFAQTLTFQASATPDPTANGSATTPSSSAEGAAGVAVAGSGTATTPAPTAGATAGVAVTAGATASTSAPSAGSTGAVALTAAGSASTPAPTADGDGGVDGGGEPGQPQGDEPTAEHITYYTPATSYAANTTYGRPLVIGSGDATTPAPTASGAGGVSVRATGSAAAPSPTANGTAKVAVAASGTASTSSPTASAAAVALVQAAGNATTPAPLADGSGFTAGHTPLERQREVWPEQRTDSRMAEDRSALVPAEVRSAALAFEDRSAFTRGEPMAPTIEWPDKTPAEVKDYELKWQLWLKPGAALANSSWTADAGITVLAHAFNADGTCTVWLSGGVAGEHYHLTNTVTDNAVPNARVGQARVRVAVRNL
jgi:hypothetical protein